MAPPPGSEQAFVNRVASLTGLDVGVVQAWVRAEGAYAPHGTGGYNFLNLREHTSKSGVPLAGTTGKGFAHFHTPADAATETAAWINGSSNYRGIRAAAKLGPRSQLAAIAASPWDSSHYNGGRNLYSAYGSLHTSSGKSWWDTAITDAGKAGTGFATGSVGSLTGVASDIAGGIPGIKDIPGVKTATGILDAPATIAEDAQKVLGFIFNPEDWLRIGYIIAGGALTLGGLFLLARSVGSTNIQSALGGSSGPAASAATLAAPEVAAARVATAHEQHRTQAARTKEVRSRRRAHVEQRRNTRTEVQRREDTAYRKGIIDASDAREAGFVPRG